MKHLWRKNCFTAFTVRVHVLRLLGRGTASVLSMSSLDENDILLLQIMQRRRVRRQRRRYCVHPYNTRCDNVGNFTIAQELNQRHEKFYSYYRMTQETFKLS